MKDITTAFAKTRKSLRESTNIEDSINLLNTFQKEVQDKLDNYVKVIEISNKVSCSKDERFLEVSSSESSRNKLTINSHTGRFTLKLSDKSSRAVNEDLVKWVKNCLIPFSDYPPITLRGKIYFDKVNSKYVWQGQSESKKFNIKEELCV